MDQKSFMTIESYDQLKALSDPFRSKILGLLVEKAYTGQQLAQLLEVPRSKIHYALNELEKNHLIQVAKKEEKRSIVQKYYKAVARGFFPGEELLPYASEISDYMRGTILNVLNRAKIKAMAAPNEAFDTPASELEKWPGISIQLEAQASKEEFLEWLLKYHELLEELKNINNPEGSHYYMTSVGFEIDEPYFVDPESEDDD